MAGRSRDNALEHVVVVVSENWSLDNVPGRLPADPRAEIPPDQALHIIRNVLGSSSPSSIRPVREPGPRRDPGVRQL
jgi:hypothetical protein